MICSSILNCFEPYKAISHTNDKYYSKRYEWANGTNTNALEWPEVIPNEFEIGEVLFPFQSYHLDDWWVTFAMNYTENWKIKPSLQW